MTDFLGNPHKKPQNTLHVLKSINNKKNPYIIKMCPDSSHKQNLRMPLPPPKEYTEDVYTKESLGHWSPPP